MRWLDSGADDCVALTLSFEVVLARARALLRRPPPKAQLRDRVWGIDFSGSLNVIEVYIKQVRQKLEAAGEPRLIHTIRGAGYILRAS